jgi:hypothetical protein
MPVLDRPIIENDDYSLIRLESIEEFQDPKIQDFDCGKKDLTDFFRNDALDHHKALLSTTFYFQPKRATEENIFLQLALISFLNDSININKEEKKDNKKGFFRFLKNNVPHPKRHYQSFPAVKIGRLGVDKTHHRNHFGSIVLNLTKELFVTKNKTGCRFITVDAYNDPGTLKFYENNGFDFLVDSDKENETRIMYYDLISHSF